MLVLLSPSKTLADAADPPLPVEATGPRFPERSAALVDRLRRFSRPGLADLMGVSDKLADLNHRRYRDWSLPFTAENAVPAVRAFRGDVYEGLAADDFDAADLAFAQASLRILSGLYGVLRPLDLIRPYRLEMGTRFPTGGAGARGPATLYEFWGDTLTRSLAAELETHRPRAVLDLASREYSKAVRADGLDAAVLTPAFKEERDGGPRVIALFAKRARGAMARWVVKERVTDPASVTGFDGLGYRYREELSGPDAPVFTRRRDSRDA